LLGRGHGWIFRNLDGRRGWGKIACVLGFRLNGSRGRHEVIRCRWGGRWLGLSRRDRLGLFRLGRLLGGGRHSGCGGSGLGRSRCLWRGLGKCLDHQRGGLSLGLGRGLVCRFGWHQRQARSLHGGARGGRCCPDRHQWHCGNGRCSPRRQLGRQSRRKHGCDGPWGDCGWRQWRPGRWLLGGRARLRGGCRSGRLQRWSQCRQRRSHVRRFRVDRQSGSRGGWPGWGCECWPWRGCERRPWRGCEC